MKRVLAVDDEPLLLELLVDELELGGYKVESASNGDAAMALLGSDHRFDVIVTDLRMPGKVDGWMLGRHALDGDPEARVVYMTGYAKMPAVLSDREKFLRKPFTMDKLYSLL